MKIDEALAAMAEGESLLKGVLFSDDSRYFLQALKDLGFFVEEDIDKRQLRIKGQGGSIPQKKTSVYVYSLPA